MTQETQYGTKLPKLATKT